MHLKRTLVAILAIAALDAANAGGSVIYTWKNGDGDTVRVCEDGDGLVVTHLESGDNVVYGKGYDLSDILHRHDLAEFVGQETSTSPCL